VSEDNEDNDSEETSKSMIERAVELGEMKAKIAILEKQASERAAKDKEKKEKDSKEWFDIST
jgi:hypothetical protein